MATNLIVPNKITGLSNHIKIDIEGNVETTTTVDAADIVIGSTKWKNYLQTNCLTPLSLLPDSFKKAMNTVLAFETENRTIIPANLILPEKLWKTSLKSYVADLKEMFKSNPSTYLDFFYEEEKLLDSLQPAYISETLFHKFSIEDTQGQVRTFDPNREGFAKKVVYDRFKAPTGRLVVKDGPSILTIAKPYRKMVQSSFPKGKIVSIDYVSLEPSVLLGRTGDTLSNWLSSTQGYSSTDIYEQVSSYLVRNDLSKPIDRGDIKNIVLRILYGAQEDLVSQIVQGKNLVPLHDFLFEIRELFGLNSLMSQLQTERRSNGGSFITNHYERRIPTDGVEDYKLINYWTQSTAVDVALLGFASIVKSFEGSKSIRPLFVLHDALFVDLDEEGIELFKKSISKGLSVPRFEDKHFHLKLKIE